MDLPLSLSFTLDQEEDVLNTTVRDSSTGSVMYMVETPKFARGALTTTAMRQNQIDGSARFAFSILWKGARMSLDGAKVVLDNRTSEELPIREILQTAPGSSVYGSVTIEDVVYKWKSKGTGSKVVLVNEDYNAVVAESHRRKRGSFFGKPRDMSLEISEAVALAVDVVLLTFILVWVERQNQRVVASSMGNIHPDTPDDFLDVITGS